MCDDRFVGEEEQLDVFATVTHSQIVRVLFTRAVYTPHTGITEFITSQFLLELSLFLSTKRVRN